MTINSNEEYLPVGSQKSISSPYMNHRDWFLIPSNSLEIN